MCNYRHPDPRRVWEVGSEPQSLTPFQSPRGSGDEFQKRPKCYYTRHFRAREVRGPFRAMRRLRSWSVSRRSRARESIAESTFIRKTHVIWKTVIGVFAERSPTPYFWQPLQTTQHETDMSHQVCAPHRPTSVNKSSTSQCIENHQMSP